MVPNTFRETARMADERPPSLVQLIGAYFDTGTLNKALGSLKHSVERLNLTTPIQD
ncbi:hypothetical protein [Lactiplantibacillus plantarum]|nr:hypothetical protein [Lactiplantibacillus plantarum]